MIEAEPQFIARINAGRNGIAPSPPNEEAAAARSMASGHPEQVPLDAQQRYMGAGLVRGAKRGSLHSEGQLRPYSGMRNPQPFMGSR
jgi:hypothetical protein